MEHLEAYQHAVQLYKESMASMLHSQEDALKLSIATQQGASSITLDKLLEQMKIIIEIHDRQQESNRVRVRVRPPGVVQ